MAVAGKKKKIFDNRYEILSIVGRGSRSVVYRARHVDGKKQEVALKVLLAKKGLAPTTDQLRKEALAMVSSRHKYVIRLDDFHSVGDLCYLSMEYAPDGDLRQYAESLGGKLSPTQCELFLLQAAEALDFIHKAGILHRDIKPDNLLVVDQQNIRLGDFGVAILPGEVSSLEELQRGVGTMSYMSPEVLSGAPYDRRSDIYALAVTMYEMLSGFHPFEGVPLAEQVNKRQNSNIPPLNSLVSSIPEHLASAIMKAMDYSPTKRYQSCREFIQGILQIKAKQLSEKAKARTTEAAPPSAKPQSQPAKPAPRPQEAVRAEPSRSEMSVSENAQQDGKSSRRSRRRKRKKKQNQEAQALTENTPISETREQRPEKKVGQVVDLEEAKRKKQISAPPKQEGRMQESEKPARERALEQGETRKEQQSTQGKAPQSEKTQPLQPQSAKQPQSDGARLADEMRKLVEGHMQAAPKRAAPPIGAARQNRPLPSKAHPQEAASPRDVTSEESSFPTEAKGNTQPEKEEVDIPIEKPKLARPFDAPQSEPVAESRRDSRKERPPKRADVSGEPSRLTQLPKKKKALSSRRHFLSQLTPPQMVLIAVASLFLLYVTSSLFDSSPNGPREGTLTVEQVSNDQIVPNQDAAALSVPFVTAESLSFPRLPSGTYSGYLIPTGSEIKTAMSFVSFAEAGEIIALLGIHGWTPARIPYPQGTEKLTLTLQSSGMILEFTLIGEPKSDELVGLYKNLVTGEEGEWKLKPIRGER